MNRLSFRLTLLLLLLPLLVGLSSAQPPPSALDTDDVVSSFKPSLAVVLTILSIMFALTFFLLLYAKLCRGGPSAQRNSRANPALIRSTSRFSGIDKTVIESLPFFRFSSLKGSKQGLECAVCLSKFEDIEILRLLPKCKHAFHINCIDQWLERHSSCPLCRHRFSTDDPTVFTYSNSMRLLFNNNSDLREESKNVEIFIQREEENLASSLSSRFKNIGGSFRKLVDKEAHNTEEEVLIDDGGKIFHKFKHKIVVSDVIFKNRWSNASSSDLMFLNSEMLNAMVSNRFSTADEKIPTAAAKSIENDQIMQIKEEIEMKRLFESKVSKINKSGTTSPNLVPLSDFPSTSDCYYSNDTLTTAYTSRTIDSSERRSVSEITGISRFNDLNMENRIKESSTLDGNERTRRVWLPIARRTIQWFANRERRSQQFQNTAQTSDV